MTTAPENFFRRTELLLGRDALHRLQQARVAVVGLGAVGSYAVEALARAGVGHLRMVDFDEIRDTNMNRQLFALRSTLGRPKTEAARQRVEDINPACRAEVLNVFADEQTAPAVLAGPPDVVIDAIDSVGPKTQLLECAVRAGVPLILSSMGAANRTDPLSIRVADIAKTDRCPLARLVRRNLRKAGIQKGIRCVYSLELPKAAPGHELGDEQVLQRGRPRRPLGSLACITGLFGLIAAREAIMAIAEDRVVNGRAATQR